MIDNYNRNIDYIRISVTDRCNLRCLYCMPEQGVEFVPHEDIMTFEEILKLCEYFAKLGIEKVKITGGEPLVRKNLPYLIENLKRIQGITNVTLTTNGILLAEQMKALTDAGLNAVNISLDTLEDTYFTALTRFPYLDKVKSGIAEALKYSEVAVKINCVPIAMYNSHESILEMVKLAKNNNLHVRFIEIMPIGLGKTLSCITEEEIIKLILENYGELSPCYKSLGNGPSRYYSIHGFKGKIGFISAVSHQFCDTCNRVRLTSKGVLKTCLQYSGGVNLKKLLREGITENDLCHIIRKSIFSKPKKHQFKTDLAGEIHGKEILEKETINNQIIEHDNMSQIGG